MTPAERFRRHHEELVEEFNRLSTKSRNGNDEAFEELFQHLETEVLPHARAEEDVLYDRVDQLTETKLSTATMRMDHRELERRVDQFDVHQFPREFDRRVNQFSTLFLHHFRKEEKVLLPFLSEELENEEFENLLGELRQREKTLVGVGSQ